VAVTLPFVLPAVVVGSAIAALVGPSGLVDIRGTWIAVLGAHLCFNLAVVVRTMKVAISSVPVELDQSARLLGVGRFGVARRVVLPAVTPALLASAVVVFMYCLTSFGVLLVLGGGRVSTLEVEIWSRATRQFDISGAAVLAVLQFIAVVAALAVHGRVARSARGSRTSGRDRDRRPSGNLEWAAVAAAIAAIGAVSVLPLTALAMRSVQIGPTWTLENWRNLGSAIEGTALAVSPARAMWLSVCGAALAAFMAVLVGVPAARSVAHKPGGASDRILLLPLGVSATTIGLGLLLAAGRPPVDLRGAWWMVPVVQAVVALPLVVRVVGPALRSIPRSYMDAASIMGRSSRQRWWSVEFPIARPAVMAGAGLALVACLGEFGATVFIARTDRPTVPIMVERLLGRPGASGYGQAMALSCVLVLMCAGVLAVVDGLGRRRSHHWSWL